MPYDPYILSNMRYDPYLIIYMTEYLKLCVDCNRYDYRVIAMNECIVCRTYYCSKCSEVKLRNDYNNYETISKYCNACHKKVFG